MATEALIERILAAGDGPSSSAIDALHELLDDATIEASAMPKSVAEAARLVGLSTHTLRYYEQEGLVRPARNASGYREYSAFDLRRLVFLTRMRVSGMTMTDLKRYILLVEQGPSTIPERRRIMLDQQHRIKRQIRELGLALEVTEYKICAYDGHPEG
ncbi:MerR family transcriptional regulator [Nocardia cyriacigeorgica]|uniref:MerR family transcriptional regulator n=1 Tax=Nocardia cyriacigeorgica TaxID=135487 RepID=UPI00189390F5|nr:MerR family transcriptional regulator [Nocardia cyriacigeorgica]MBF6088490.1 MerR family transcriptional regulator [Nocardia cyriacigeorgica]MBF6095595.1 MerR family transcriptional regulator [Nocardia cyriacigeorgica]MBF6096526.1 MerR family transcriptional regulator [Nocardia cyriacigeorgica]MBF6162941.1 MerR family transcriptional regulator [Nocardia cyriacigeorgica]MBF6201895.1 MerR family transcriptional regulator [Nocardia cyriacigeorgica]